MSSDMLYLVLRNGYRFHDLILNAGQIYTSADFEEINDQRKAALVVSRILYRGTEADVKDKRAKFFGITDDGEYLSKRELKRKTTK